MLKPKWLIWTIPVLMVLMAASANAIQLLQTKDYVWDAYDPDTGDPIGNIDVNEKYAYIDKARYPGDPFVGNYYYLYTVGNFTSPGTDLYDFHVQNGGPGGQAWVLLVSYPSLWMGWNNPGVIDWDTDSAPVFGPGGYNSAGAIPTGWTLNAFDVVVTPAAHPYHGTVLGWVTDVNGKIVAKGPVSGVTPEPGTLILLGFGLAGIAAYGWHRKKKEG